MTVITLSRHWGSHGEAIAATLAQKLDLRLVDAETIKEAAQRAGVPQMALAELAHEGERGLANQVLKALRTMPSLQTSAPRSPGPEAGAPSAEAPASSSAQEGVGLSGWSGMTIPFAGLFSPTVPPISASLEEYVRMVGLVIRGLAREGNVIIVGRGGQVLLRKHPHAFHVQIVAPFDYRVRVVMQREALSKRAAQSRVRASDRARFDYVRRYHDADWLDPTLYHLVLNSAWVPTAKAVDLIVAGQQMVTKSGSRSGR